jgi:hypothetical protein
MSNSYAKYMRRTRKHGGMFRGLPKISGERQQSNVSESNPKHKTSSLRSRIQNAIITAQNVYPVAEPVAEPVAKHVTKPVTKPVVAESSNIPVAHAVPVKEANATPSLSEMIVNKKIDSKKVSDKKVSDKAPAKASTSALKPLQGKSSEKPSMTMDNLEQIMNEMKPKPPPIKKSNPSPRIKPPQPKGPLPKELVNAIQKLGKIMPPEPPPRNAPASSVKPKITKKEVSLQSVVKAILEDNIKILTEAEPDPNNTPEVDTTTISRFYMERIRASKMDDVCRAATVSYTHLRAHET